MRALTNQIADIISPNDKLFKHTRKWNKEMVSYHRDITLTSGE